MNPCICEICGRSLCCQTEKRFLVKLDIQPMDNLLKPVLPDIDSDPIDMLQQLIETNCETSSESLEKSQKFHLCCDCYLKFINDPFGRNNPRRVHFSSN